MKKHILTLILIVSICTANYAQLSSGGTPFSFDKSTANSTLIEQEIKNSMVLKKPNVDSLLAIPNDVNGPYFFGIAQNVNINIKGKTPIPTGNGKLWIWKLSFPDALSLNANFSKFKLGRDAKLFIYSADKTQVLGSFSSINNQDHQTLSTGLIAGSEIVIEYYESNKTTDSEIILGNVGYGFRDAIGTIKNDFIKINESSTCNANVNCSADANIQTVKRGVAKILYQSTGGGYFVCSGGLMNNTDQNGLPYFLTAFHCYNGSVPSSYVFYFNYESPNCTNPASAPSNTLSGSVVRATLSGADMALMQINNYPPASYNVHYLGYSALGVTPPNTTGIHHPRGDIKKLSLDNQAPTSGSVTISGQTAEVWNTRFDSGTTEGGSSGSPLFDNNFRVIGQLFGVGWGYGGAFDPCNLQGNTQYYGRVSVSYHTGTTPATRLQNWLSPVGTVGSLDGTDCPVNSPACNYCSVTLYSSGATGNCLDSDGLNSLTVNGTNLSTNSGCSANGYNYFSSVPTLSLERGSTVNFTASLLSAVYNEDVAIWIDFNKDKKYTADEKVFQSGSLLTGTFNNSFALSCSAATGITRMRIRVIYNSGSTPQNVQPCDLYGNGEVEEYNVNIIGANAPIITSSPNSVCAGQSTQIIASGCSGTYLWSNGGTGTSITVSPTTTQSYSVICTSTCGTSSSSVNITVNPQPYPSQLTYSGTVSLCPSQRIIVGANFCNGTISWSNGQTTNMIEVTSPGTYYVMCTNSCGTASSNGQIAGNLTVTDGTIPLTLSGTLPTFTSEGHYQYAPIISTQKMPINTANAYHSAKKIELNPGFKADKWSYFEAKIINNCTTSEGLVLDIPFFNNANDFSGNNRHGSINAATLTTGRKGNPNSAYNFNGTNNSISFGSWFNLQEFSISLWVNAATTQANAYAEIIDNNHNQNRSWLSQQSNTTNNNYDFAANGTTSGGAVNYNLTPNTWTHLVFVKGNGFVKVYKDNVLVNTATHVGNIPYDGTQNLILGAWWASGNFARFWSGKMDDLKIYNRVLSVGEINRLFNE